MKPFDIEAVKRFIQAQSSQTRIYIGVDSERIRENTVWYAVYTAAVVVHIDGRHGCRLFGEVTRERDWDQRADRPTTRLMNEVYKAADLYQRLASVLEDRPVEVHLDINSGDEHASSAVVAQAIGYIRGTCNITPKIKPQAFAATNAADRMRHLKIANS